jgi:hypothetical protein
MKKKDTAITLLVIAVLVSTVGVWTYHLGAGEAYFQGLADGMAVDENEEGKSPFSSTVYYYKNGIYVGGGPNVITNPGLNESRHHLCDNTWVNNNATTQAFRWLAIGTGNGGGASSTNLTTMFDRQIATFAVVSGVNGNWTMTYTWSAGAFGGETIQEAGMFNADSGTAILLNYQDFTGITLQATDSLQVQFMFQISSG